MHTLLIQSIICTVALFTAHAFPLNTRVIEPAMLRKDIWAYPAGFVYYGAFIYAALAIFDYVKTHY